MAEQDFRHRFALQNLLTLKPHIDELNDWESEFLLSILENGRLDEDHCTLTSHQFNKLKSIELDARKRGIL